MLCLFLDRGLLPPAAFAHAASTLLPALSGLTAVLGRSSIASTALPASKGNFLGWQAMLLPSAAAALVLQGQHYRAAALAARHCALPAALATVEEGMLLLVQWLQAHERVLSSAEEPRWEECSDLAVPHAARRLWADLQGNCRTALACLKRELGDE